MGAFDYLAPEEVARLLQQRVLLAPQTTQCTVPAEVAGGVQGASLMMTAFGPEANFSHPAPPRRRAARLGARMDGQAPHPLRLYGHARHGHGGDDARRHAATSSREPHRSRPAAPLARGLGAVSRHVISGRVPAAPRLKRQASSGSTG